MSKPGGEEHKREQKVIGKGSGDGNRVECRREERHRLESRVPKHEWKREAAGTRKANGRRHNTAASHPHTSPPLEPARPFSFLPISLPFFSHHSPSLFFLATFSFIASRALLVLRQTSISIVPIHAAYSSSSILFSVSTMPSQSSIPSFLHASFCSWHIGRVMRVSEGEGTNLGNAKGGWE